MISIKASFVIIIITLSLFKVFENVYGITFFREKLYQGFFIKRVIKIFDKPSLESIPQVFPKSSEILKCEKGQPV
jgi:hypothetical protein